MNDNAPNYETAESYRKAQKYQEAHQQFAHLWQQSPKPHIGWRYAYCLRKLGQLDEAEKNCTRNSRKISPR